MDEAEVVLHSSSSSRCVCHPAYTLQVSFPLNYTLSAIDTFGNQVPVEKFFMRYLDKAVLLL